MGPPRSAWGWHRLDDSWAERLVRLSGVGSGDLVIDVGAGSGALVGPLLDAGARVIAVERHPERAAELRERFGAGIRVVRADAADLRLPRRPFHVVANPPFAITAPLLARLVHPGSRMVSAHLVLQRQVVDRWVSGRGRAVRGWPARFVADAGLVVPRRAFSPAPAVDCRVLVLRRR